MFFFRRPDSEMVNQEITLAAIDGTGDYDVSITGESYIYGPWKRMKGREFICPEIQITEKAASALLRYRKIAPK